MSRHLTERYIRFYIMIFRKLAEDKMLVEDASLAFRIIIEEHNRFKIDQLLERAVNLCAQKTSIKDIDFRQMARNIHIECASIALNTKLDDITRVVYDKIHNSEYKIIIPRNIAKYISSAISEEKLMCATSNEISLQKNEITILIARIMNWNIVYNEVFMGDEYETFMDVTFDILIPRVMIDNKFDGFVAISREMEVFVSLVSDLVEDGGRVEIVKISASDLTLTIALSAASAALLISVYIKIIEAIRKTFDLMRSFRELSIHSDVLEKLSSESTIDEYVRVSADKILDKIISNVNNSSGMEKKTRLQSRLPKISRLVSAGLRVDVDKGRSRIATLAETGQVGSDKDVASLISEMRKLTAALDAQGAMTGFLEFQTDEKKQS